MTDFLERAAIYWIALMALWLIRLIMHDESWKQPNAKRLPTACEPLMYALVSPVPFLRAAFAALAVWHLFVPPKGSRKYEEMKALHEEGRGRDGD